MCFDTWHTLDCKENVYKYFENFTAPVGYMEQEKFRIDTIDCFYFMALDNTCGTTDRPSVRVNVSPCCLYRQSQNSMQHGTENTAVLINV